MNTLSLIKKSKLKKHQIISTLISVLFFYTANLFADSTLVVINNQSCLNCYADVSNLKNNDFVFIYIKDYPEKKAQKFVNKYFSGLGFQATQWCPPEIKGLEGVATIRKGKTVSFLPIGWRYATDKPKTISLEEYSLSESLVYSISQNAITLKDKAFNECLIFEQNKPFSFSISDSSTQFSVYAKLGLIPEKNLIQMITSQIGGGLNEHLVLGDLKIVEDKIHALANIRRLSGDTLYTQPIMIVMDRSQKVEEIISFTKEFTYRIGTRTFSILKNGDYRFVVTPPDGDNRANGYKFIYTFSNTGGTFEPVDTLSITVDSFYDGDRNKFNSTSVYSINGCWAYTAVPAFFDAEKLSDEPTTNATKLAEYENFRLGYDDHNVFNVDYKFKGIASIGKDSYLILYRYLNELKFKIISKQDVIGFGNLGEIEPRTAVFLAGNTIYTVQNDELSIRKLFKNL